MVGAPPTGRRRLRLGARIAATPPAGPTSNAYVNCLKYVLLSIILPLVTQHIYEFVLGDRLDDRAWRDFKVFSFVGFLVLLALLEAKRLLTWRRLVGLLAAVLVVELAAVAITDSVLSRSRFNFEDGTVGEWGVRVESDIRLGNSVETTDAMHRGPAWEHWSLAFAFSIGAAPLDKAQIKIEGQTFEEELAAWVYVPRGLPRTLALSAFVLEDNRSRVDPSRPDWPFYKSPPTLLTVGGWTRVRYRADELVGVNTNALTWSNPALLLGFQITKSDGGTLDATVYFDRIRLR